MRLGTFNMENLDDRVAPDAADLAARLPVLRPQIQRMRADILCLQEINAHCNGKRGPRTLAALDAVLDGTDYAGYGRACSHTIGSDRPASHHNLVTLSRYPILRVRQVWNDLVPAAAMPPLGIEMGWDRPILITDHALPDGRCLTVINVHLRAPRAAWIAGEKLPQNGGWRSVQGWAHGFHLACQKQIGQALEIRLACEQIFQSQDDALLVVCGDFNASDHDAVLRLIRADEEDTGNGSLAARTLIPVERSISADRRFSVIHHGRPVMLDHILASRALLGRLHHVEIHNEMVGDELTAPHYTARPSASYHSPVVAEFVSVV